jgi:hypothetical protein
MDCLRFEAFGPDRFLPSVPADSNGVIGLENGANLSNNPTIPQPCPAGIEAPPDSD